MTYQPFLPEAAAGSVEPRHVVVPLRRVLDKCEVLTGRFVSLDHERRVARIQPTRGEAYDLSYEVVVLAPGSIARTLPIPGLAELGIGFKQVEEAIALRNQVLDKLDIATSVTDHAARRQAAHLRVRRRRLRRHRGAGRARGHGALRDPLLPRPVQGRHAVRARRGDRPDPARGRRGPRPLHRRASCASARSTSGSNTRLESCVGGHIVLSDGEEFDAETLVWTAGVKANPVLAQDRPAAGRQGPAALPRRPAGRGRRRRLVGGRRRRRCPTSPPARAR